jgi:hypothetical protein
MTWRVRRCVYAAYSTLPSQSNSCPFFFFCAFKEQGSVGQVFLQDGTVHKKGNHIERKLPISNLSCCFSLGINLLNLQALYFFHYEIKMTSGCSQQLSWRVAMWCDRGGLH